MRSCRASPYVALAGHILQVSIHPVTSPADYHNRGSTLRERCCNCHTLSIDPSCSLPGVIHIVYIVYLSQVPQGFREQSTTQYHSDKSSDCSPTLPRVEIFLTTAGPLARENYKNKGPQIRSKPLSYQVAVGPVFTRLSALHLVVMSTTKRTMQRVQYI